MIVIVTQLSGERSWMNGLTNAQEINEYFENLKGFVSVNRNFDTDIEVFNNEGACEYVGLVSGFPGVEE